MSPSDTIDNFFLPQIVTKTQNCFYVIFDLAQAAKISTNLIGYFPHKSSRENNYIFLAYNYDGSAILVDTMLNREADTIISTWKNVPHDSLRMASRQITVL